MSAVYFRGGPIVTEKAREALPWLVGIVESRKTPVTYKWLGERIGAHPYTVVPRALGAIGSALEELKPKLGKIPPIQLIVISGQRGIPGDSGLTWVISREQLAKWTREQKEIFTKGVQKDVFEWTRWRQVLSELGLEPLKVGIAPSQEELKRYEAAYERRGEGEDHRRLKEYVASNPVKLGLAMAGTPPVKEYITLSGDRLDVFFESPERWTCVEVKGSFSSHDDVRRGIFQCVKYRSVLEAQRHYGVTGNKLPDVRVVLVLANEFPQDLRAIRDVLNVEVMPHVTVPERFHVGSAAS